MRLYRHRHSWQKGLVTLTKQLPLGLRLEYKLDRCTECYKKRLAR